MRSSDRVRGTLIALALDSLLLQPTGALAQPARAPQRQGVEVNGPALAQKATMVERLLFDSPVAARVASSQNDEARRHLSNARELLTHGKALAGSGQLRGADALLNEAIWEIGRAQQLAPDQTARLVEERARYEQLRGSVDALLRTYELGLTQGRITLRSDATGERSVTGAMSAVDTARQQADAGQVAEANRTLGLALGGLLKDALHRLDGQTLVYDRRFASTREEFGFELARHRSLDALVPLAQLEFRPPKEALILIERYQRQARSARERAEAQAAANDHAAALQALVEGTEALQRALQASGLTVPQTMGTP